MGDLVNKRFEKQLRTNIKNKNEIFKIYNYELIDEDGLGLKLLKENDIYTMKDKDNNKMIFRKRDNLWYLEEIINSLNNKVMVNYDTNNRIIKIIDADNNEINVVYNSNNMVISSNVLTTTLNYTNDLLTSINNKYGTIHITYNSNNIIMRSHKL